MQMKRYTMPSARSRTQIKRNILNTVAQSENIDDDSWLNDVHSGSLTSTTQTQEHTVCYEDLPTMPLSLFTSLPIQQLTPNADKANDSSDEDLTVKLTKSKKSVPSNPLDTLLSDESIMSITALGPHRILVERNGRVLQTPLHFANEQHMMQIIEQLLQTAGQVMPTHHFLTVTLPNGFVLTLALPPNALHGPVLTLRRQPKHTLTLHDLVRRESMSQAMADTLAACVRARLNIILCGHNGSGRTTLLNALCAMSSSSLSKTRPSYCYSNRK